MQQNCRTAVQGAEGTAGDKKGLPNFHQEGHIISGNDLLFHLVTKAVPSAQEGLTTLFGMGRGVTPPPKSPEFFTTIDQ